MAATAIATTGAVLEGRDYAVLPPSYPEEMGEEAHLMVELDRREDCAVTPSGTRVYEFIMRIFDVVFASILLVVCSPVMLLAALLIKLTSRGPVLFRQLRAGKDCKPFVMLKFRSMRNGAVDERELFAHLNTQKGPVFKIPDDPRVTSIGRFLRRSSIDELPQLINVLRGEMSLVGPRPLWLPEAERVNGLGKFRTKVKPGLTCLWQISGRSELAYDEWVLLDLYYLRRRGLLLDLLILIQTLPAVLGARGAY